MVSPIQNIIGKPDPGSLPVAPKTPGDAAAFKPASSTASAAPVSDTKPAPKPTPASNPADLRLVIEDDKAAGCFVYKVINRTTGEVVQQAPQEQIVKLREADGYLAGDVIKAQA